MLMHVSEYCELHGKFKIDTDHMPRVHYNDNACLYQKYRGVVTYFFHYVPH